MDGPSDTRKVDGNSRNVLQACGKVTVDPADARKADGSRRNVLWIYGKLTEDPVDAQKSDGWSCDCTEI